MKPLVALSALAALAACVPPTTSQNAIPFGQVLAANPAYECSDYDPGTDSCTAITTYEAQGGGRYLARSMIVLDDAMPPVQFQTTIEEEGNRSCADFADVSVSSSGASDMQTELIFAQMESMFRSFGTVCAVYLPSGTGYVARIVEGPEIAMADRDTPVQFFDAPKRLRVEN